VTDEETKLVGAIVAQLGQEHFGTGQLAELRRMDPTRPATAPATLYRLLAQHPDDQLRGGSGDRWALVVHLLALAAPEQHCGGNSLGTALAHAKYSEGRLTRLLEADVDMFAVVLPRMVRFLIAKGEAIPHLELANFVLWGGSDRDRRRIARDYYRAESTSSQSTRESSPEPAPTTISSR
jgi:CRISPR system Cascade subunit CasB